MSTRMIVACVTCLLIAGTSLNGTTIPERPTASDLSGTWLAVEEFGDVCRLDVDAINRSGQMVCTNGHGLFHTSIRDLKRDENLGLTIMLDGNETLSGEVFDDRFAVEYGEESMVFLKLSRISTALKRLGGRLSMDSKAPAP